MRRPAYKQARRELESSVDAMTAEGLPIHTTRNAIPPDDWDDLIVSYRRGQDWSRKYR